MGVRYFFIGICSILCAGLTNAEDKPVSVLTYAEHQGGNVIYRYEIRGNAASNAQRFFIGCDCRTNGVGLPQLQTVPVNATRVRTDDFATWYELPPDAVQQPAGWRVRLVQPRGATGYWIEWYRPGARAGTAVEAALAGFAVAIPGADEAYLTARYTVQTEDDQPGAGGTVTTADTTPPTLRLETRTLHEHGAATVQVVATVADDIDPEPAVAAESMHLDRSAAEASYTVVYSATDASGNRSTASARIPLPAIQKTAPGDQGPKPRNLPHLALLP